MERDEPKIDKALMQELEKLAEEEEIDVLLYPKEMSEDFKGFLVTKKNEGLLDYNILQLANCVVIKARKRIILEIAGRHDVARTTIHPKFTAH